MAYFTGADAKGQRAKCAMCACVAVAADDRHTRLRHAHLWPYHVDNALYFALDVPERNAKLGAILA